MASNLDTVILFADACDTFITEILPMIQESEQRLGHIDIPARCEGWNNWIDSLNQSDQISDWQVVNWSHITDVSPALQRR